MESCRVAKSFDLIALVIAHLYVNAVRRLELDNISHYLITQRKAHTKCIYEIESESSIMKREMLYWHTLVVRVPDGMSQMISQRARRVHCLYF